MSKKLTDEVRTNTETVISWRKTWTRLGLIRALGLPDEAMVELLVDDPEDMVAAKYETRHDAKDVPSA